MRRLQFLTKKHKFSISTLTRILSSYIAVLLLPLIASSFIFMQVNATMMSNLDNYNNSILGQVSITLDNVVNTASRLANLIAHDSDLNALLSTSGQMDAYQIYLFSARLRDVCSLGSNVDMIESFSVYFHEADIVLSSGSKGTPEQYFKYLYGYQNEDHYQLWYDHVLHPENNMSFIGNMPFQDGSDFYPGVYYIQSLPYPYRSLNQKKATIFVKINDKKIQESIQNIYAANNSLLFVLDNKGNIILHNSTDIGLIEASPKQLVEDTTLIKYQNHGYYFKKFTSQQTEWSIYCYTPQNEYISALEWMQATFIIVLFLCLIAGLLMSYYLARKNYSPIKELMNIVTTDQSKAIDNEYSFLKERVQSINAERKSLEKEIDRQAPIIKNALLLRLLKGQVSDSELNNITQLAQINIENTAYIVMLIDIDNCQSFIESDNEYEWFLARYAVSNVVQEILEKSFNPSIADIERNRLGIILDFNKNNINAKEIAIESANQMIQTIKEYTMIDTSISLSDVEFDLKNLFNAYINALSIMENKLIKGTGNVLIQNFQSDQYYYYTVDEEEHLIHKARIGALDEVESQLDHIYDINFIKRSLSPYVARCLLWDMLNTVMKTANSLGLKLEDLDPNHSDFLNEFNDSQTIDEKMNLIRSLYGIICATTSKRTTSGTTGIIQQIEKYIDTHYTDCMFSISQMADELKFTRQYLSDVYKKQTNQTILAYLTTVRIEHAKELLKDGTLTIVAVATAVGYIDDAGFRKAFKKTTGYTPGKYRTMYFK